MKVGWGRGWLVTQLLIGGCGGRATSPDDDQGNPAGGEPGEPSAGGVFIYQPPVASGGAGGEGQGAPPSLIDSATRFCGSESECFGQACVAPPALPGICAVACKNNHDCARDEVCVQAAAGSHCYPPCDSPEDCAYAFDCFRFDVDVGLICFPAPWTSGWR